MSKVTPKIKSIAFDNLLITATKVGSSSILDKSGKKTTHASEVQEVVMKGPFTKVEGGLDVEVGDRVVIDSNKNIVKTVVFIDKATGEYIYFDPSKPEPKEEDVDVYMLLSNRAVVMVLK